MTKRASHMRLGEFDWIAVLIHEFLNVYDLNGIMFDNLQSEGLLSPTNTKIFVQWLKNKGWVIEYWADDSFITGSQWGISIKDTCPMFIEHKLRVM